MNMIFTTDGLDEIATLIAAGNPVQITELAIGTGTSPHDASSTALQTELKRLAVTGDKTADANVHLTAVDSTSEEYTVYEAGIYLASGTLLAVFGDGTAITGKAARVDAVFAIDLPLAQFADAEVVIGGTGFMLPQATESVAGLAVLANDAEARAGTETAKVVTPAGVKAALENRTATAVSTGLVKLATNTETTTGTDSSRAVTPAGVKAAIDARTASETKKGIVELATTTEAEAGTDTERAMTPAGVKASIEKNAFLPSNQTDIWNGFSKSVPISSLSEGLNVGIYEIAAGYVEEQYVTWVHYTGSFSHAFIGGWNGHGVAIINVVNNEIKLMALNGTELSDYTGVTTIMRISRIG